MALAFNVSKICITIMIKLNKSEYKINLLFNIVCLILSLGIPLNYSSPFIVLLFIALRIVTANKDTIGLYFCLYGAVIGGMIRALYPFIPIYGIFLVFMGLFLSRDYIKVALTKNTKGLLCLLAVFVLFYFYYLFGPQTKFATDKMIKIISNGSLFYISYACLCKSKKIHNEVMAHLLLLSTIFFFVVSKALAPIGSPKTIIDFAWYRDHFIADSNMVFYQTVGMNALLALLFYYGQKGCHFFTVRSLMLLVTGTYLTLMSGARQSVLGLVFLLPFAYFLQAPQNSHNFLKIANRLVVMMICAFVLFQLLEMMNISYFSQIFDDRSNSSVEEKINRGINYSEAYNIIEKNLAEGTGLGGYNYITKHAYPHNFFLEMLCECGLFGLFMFLFIVVIYIYMNPVKFTLMTHNNTLFFVIYSSLFLTNMISGDFTDSIVLFSALFSTSIIKTQYNIKRYKKSVLKEKMASLKSLDGIKHFK